MLENASQYGWWPAGAAAGFTVMASYWSDVHGFYQQIVSRVIVQITASEFVADALLLDRKTRFSASKFRSREYMGWMLFVRPRQRVPARPDGNYSYRRKSLWARLATTMDQTPFRSAR